MKKNKAINVLALILIASTVGGCHTLQKIGGPDRGNESTYQESLTLPPDWQKAPDIRTIKNVQPMPQSQQNTIGVMNQTSAPYVQDMGVQNMGVQAMGNASAMNTVNAPNTFVGNQAPACDEVCQAASA